jgi:hypothetical protein
MAGYDFGPRGHLFESFHGFLLVPGVDLHLEGVDVDATQDERVIAHGHGRRADGRNFVVGKVTAMVAAVKGYDVESFGIGGYHDCLLRWFNYGADYGVLTL